MVDKSILASLESVVLMAERLTEDDRAVIKSLLMESMDVIRWATTDLDKLVYFSNPCIEKLHTTVDKISSL